MGCDGGTIPKRHELVKTAKRGEQKDKDMERSAKWTSCTISQQALTTPIMMCELGRLYSKESMLEYILDRSVSDACGHITSMKNVKELKLTPNPDYKKTTDHGCHDQYFDTQRSEYVCPVVGLEMNGKYKFCAIWSCGCVVSERALKEVDTDTCHNCGSKFLSDDIIVINPDDDDLEILETNMQARRERMKAMRKEKKAKKSKSDVNESGCSTEGQSSSTNGKTNGEHVFEVPKKIPKLDHNETTSSKKPSKNDCELDVGKKRKGDKKRAGSSSSSSKARRNNEQDGAGSSKGSSSDSSGSGGGDSKLDPKQSSVYKKLFTSGVEKKGNDKTAHWVTYNPYHL